MGVDFCRIYSDVEFMWRRLDEKYGDQQKLVDSIMNEVAKLTTSNTEESALKMIHTIQRAHQDLKRLNLEAESVKILKKANLRNESALH